MLQHGDVTVAVSWVLDVVSGLPGGHGHVMHAPSHGKKPPAWGHATVESQRCLELTLILLSFSEIAMLTRQACIGDVCVLVW